MKRFSAGKGKTNGEADKAASPVFGRKAGFLIRFSLFRRTFPGLSPGRAARFSGGGIGSWRSEKPGASLCFSRALHYLCTHLFFKNDTDKWPKN